ncbi:condensin-2 complex subunit G2 isoform X1 [Solea senegalensis]|uniref:Condensin-2 complex subunit G2 isoform X1 n=2 Tax=Solea senegalensis TaxID=28829 RepID=A0AAV6TAH4_SOLSE|nr:condensin-2 complex subunit G2 [Solea senegalensis]KAG7526439.1 condensin-2 complex subunit G2 isoform X1 [Solea senegalensis]
MSKREAFLQAARKENVEDFLHFIQLHKDKAEPFDVEEVVQEMPRDQREALWERLDSLLQDVLQELPPERWEERQEPGREEGMEVESAQDPKRVIAVVDSVTLVALVSLKILQDGDTYCALLEIVNKLHVVLVSLPVSETPTALQLHIHTLCEAWWKKGLKEKEKFGHTAFVISLQKSLILKKPGVEIQRVWSLRDVLLSLDYSSQDNKEIIDFLLQCFHHPVYIKNDDGKRFLVFLFSWNVDFIWVIHGTIKNQLEFYSKALTTHITEIYFRAWKKARGDFLEQIESTCIQDFMQCAIFLHRSSPVHTKVRQIVSYFHSRKSCPNVDKMLDNLYKPILWKALSVPNSEVRANATLLFTDAFPVHDPSQSKEIIDKNIQKQLDTAMNLLEDPYPIVRSNAALGVCKILAKCWELIPPTILTDFLKKLVTELANDTSSPDVRCSIFKSLTIILDNALSHPVLEKLLPTLKYSLHDNSEKVRAAFLDMLIKAKAVRAAKFWAVCHMDHLLARLATDGPSVSKRIAELLFKSFFPVNESEKEWCSRCITLIQMNPVAARKFYQHAYKHTAPTNIIKLMLVIRRVLNSCIQANCDMSELNDSNKENSAMAEPLTLGKDMAVVSGLLEVVVILWRSVEKALKQNEETQKYIFAKFGNVMSKYFQALEDERCTVPLVQLASFMPPAAVPTFSCGVLSRLKRMEPGAVQTQYSQLLDCICCWGQAADVLELITEWLTEPLPKQGEKSATSRRVRIQETVEAKPDLALAYLEFLFNHISTREKILTLGQKPLKQLHTVLGNWKSVLYTHLSSTTEDPKSPSLETALKAFMLHSRLGAHLQHSVSEGRDYLLSLEHVAAWVAERVLPFLADDGQDSEESQRLPVQIIESFLAVCRDVLLVGLGDETFQRQILHLCSLVLVSEAGYLGIPAVLPVLKEVAGSYVPDDNDAEAEENPEDGTTIILGVVANIFQKIIELLARHLKKEPEKGKQLCQSAVSGLSDFLQVAQTWDRAPLSGVFSTVFAVMVVEKRYLFQKMTHPEEVITPESVEDMPPLSGVLLSIILKSPHVCRAFLREVRSSLESEAISSLLEVAAVLHILTVLKHAGSSKVALKSTATCVQQQLHTHAVTSSDSTGVQGMIFESSVRTLNHILDL